MATVLSNITNVNTLKTLNDHNITNINTLKTRNYALKMFYEFVKTKGLELNENACLEFIKYLIDNGAVYKTVRTRAAILLEYWRGNCNFSLTHNDIGKFIDKYVEQQNIDSFYTQRRNSCAITEQDLERAIAKIEEEFWHYIGYVQPRVKLLELPNDRFKVGSPNNVEFLSLLRKATIFCCHYFLAWRVAEMLNITSSDVIEENGRLFIHRNRIKGGISNLKESQKVVPLLKFNNAICPTNHLKKLMAVLQLRGQNERLFYGKKNGRVFYHYIVKQYFGKDYSSHSFRYGGVMYFAKQGANDSDIMIMTGHRSADTLNSHYKSKGNFSLLGLYDRIEENCNSHIYK